MLRQPEFGVFLFIFCMAVFSWPLLSIPGGQSLRSMFFYLYLFWAAVIVLLFLVSLHGNRSGKSDDRLP